MKSLHFTAIALLASTAGVAAQEADIVVTGTPLARTEANLEACIVRKCSPEEDIDATLAHAENQFVAGRYKDARQTLERSIGRNRRFGREYPASVSELFRAKATVAEHLGEPQTYKLAVIETRDTLKDNLPGDDSRIFIAELEVGDSRLKLGYPDEARQKYRDVERRALARNLPRVAAHARMRFLSLLVSEAQAGGKGPWREKAARDEIAAFIANPIPGAEAYGDVAELLLARLDRTAGIQDTTDALIAKIVAQTRSARPTLVYAPSLEEAAAEIDGGRADRDPAQFAAVDKWADVGFWVNEYGRVEDAEVLRDNGEPVWTGVVLRSIRGRIYVPAAASDGTARRFFMIERYTLTAPWFLDTGSRIRKRSATRRIERLDLTP